MILYILFLLTPINKCNIWDNIFQLDKPHVKLPQEFNLELINEDKLFDTQIQIISSSKHQMTRIKIEKNYIIPYNDKIYQLQFNSQITNHFIIWENNNCFKVFISQQKKFLQLDSMNRSPFIEIFFYYEGKNQANQDVFVHYFDDSQNIKVIFDQDQMINQVILNVNQMKPDSIFKVKKYNKDQEISLNEFDYQSSECQTIQSTQNLMDYLKIFKI